MNWDDLRVFTALARAGTLSGAARRLGVNHATVARRLAEAERALGRPLFDRDRAGYRLTPFGEAVLAQAQVMDDAALAIEKLGDGVGALSGAVRLTTAGAMANGYLAGRLADLLAAHAGLEVTLVAESRILSLAQREADIAVRLGRPTDADLVGSHVADIAYGFFAAPPLKAAIEAGAAPAFIGFDRDNPASEGLWLARQWPDARVAFRSNNQLSQAAAARSGAGVALLPCYLAHGDGRLLPIRLGPPPPPREVWLMTRRDLARVPRFRVVMDYLAERFRMDRAMFGEAPY